MHKIIIFSLAIIVLLQQRLQRTVYYYTWYQGTCYFVCPFSGSWKVYFSATESGTHVHFIIYTYINKYSITPRQQYRCLKSCKILTRAKITYPQQIPVVHIPPHIKFQYLYYSSRNKKYFRLSPTFCSAQVRRNTSRERSRQSDVGKVF